MIRILYGVSLAAFIATSAFAQEGTRLSAADRAAIVEEIAQTVDENFYDEARAAQIAADLRGADFTGIETHEDLAEALTAQLHAEDRHFGVRYVGPDAVAAMMSQDGGGPGEPAGDRLAQARRGNFGFREVSILPGNIGYVDLRQFAPAHVAGETARAALDFIAHTDAVIFDMRNNGGGDPSMVQFLISHFLDPQGTVAINTFVSRQFDFPAQLNSLSYLPSGARPDVPIYVLTSSRTGSAGEAFPYHLQAMERATIVGETTYGAGNPGDTFVLESGYSIFISTGSARNPITGTNWEGVGVAPDIEAPAADALDVALVAAYDALLDTGAEEGASQSWAWARDEIDARLNPQSLPEDQLADYVGTYGPRRIYADGGALYYQREDQAPRELTPLGEDRFLFGDDGTYRLTFTRDRRGSVVELALLSLDRPPSTSAKD